MSSTVLEIKLKSPSKTFTPGDKVSGNVVIRSSTTIKHDGVDIHFDGKISTQKILPMSDNFHSATTTSKPTVLIGACEKLLPSGKLGVGLTELPFTFDLVSGTGQALMETYHGVNVSVTYTLRAELKRSLLQQNFVKNEEIYVELEGEKTTGHLGKRHEFVISGKNNQAQSNLSNFSATGYFDSLLCCLPKPLSGSLRISESEIPITSIDLVLHRVENTTELTKVQKSEIVSLQVGEGDVRRDADIPLRLVMPRYFTCPNVKSALYDLDFQISVDVSFANGYSISECMDVTLKRLV